MNPIENQLTQLRLNGMHSSWKAMVETRQHHELSFGEGLEVLLQAEAEDRTHLVFIGNNRGFRKGKSIYFKLWLICIGLNKSST
ncbi:hypothetical protein SAMN04488033_11875 [Salegentibacter agarivorans]|uniref:Uncharacterized protein n=1 Tax=Salegentibacter agarivorans TaxID=345907 RepID=A0A1I2NB76_9FLAO|nr:hypothetical protein [Salegentibacter agarivorans]SFF98746.1 hypothetical protein SAMN04488033_11875 [Salegentibacter agarivorans]